MNVTTSKSGDYIERVTSLKLNKPKAKKSYHFKSLDAAKSYKEPHQQYRPILKVKTD